MKTALAITLTLGLGATAAHAEIPRAGDLTDALGKWRVVDVRTGGFSQVTSTRPDPFGGAGSLEQTLPEPGDSSWKTEVERFSADTVHEPGRGLVPTAGGFGRVADMQGLWVSWYRDGTSTAWPWLGTAVRVYVYDPDLGVNGTSSIMIWEPVYSGYATGPNFAVPVDQWIESSLHQENFWRSPLYLDGVRVPRSFCTDNPNECHRYQTLAAWGFSPRAVIFGFSLGLGGGWNGGYRGWVDALSLQLTGGQVFAWDFEPGASPAPQICAEDDRRARRRARRARRHAQR